MTIYEYVEALLKVRDSKIIDDDATPPGTDRENAAFEAVQLISGRFTYRLYETLRLSDFPMEAVTSHLEAMCDKSDFHGFLYFLILLADSIDFTFPYSSMK